MTLPGRCNLEMYCRPDVMRVLVSFMDLDGDGRILYKEFTKIFCADDVFETAGISEAPSGAPVP